MIRRKKTISSDLSTSLAILVAIVSIMIIILNFYLLKRNSERIWHQKIDEISAYLKHSLELPVWNVDESSINGICDVMFGNELVASLRLTDPNGSVFFEAKKKDISTVITRTEKIYYEKYYIGELTIGLTPEPYHIQNRRLIWGNIVSLFVIILILMTSTRFLLRVFLRNPFNKLLDRIEHIRKGDYNYAPQPIRQEEIQTIVQEFDQMARQVQLRETNLTDVNIRLEKEIKERQEAVEALAVSERNYREIFNGTSDAIIIYNAENGAIIDVNRSMLEMYGYAYSEATALTVMDLSLGEPLYGRSEAETWMRKAMQQGPQLFEWRAKRKNGELFWSEVSLIYSEISGKGCILASVRDISLRKKVEAELAESKSLLLAAIEYSPAGIIIADAPDIHIRIANSAARGIRGMTNQALTHIPFNLHPEQWQAFHPDGTPFDVKDLPLTRAILKGEISRNIEVIIQRPDGSKRWVLANAAPVFDENGKIVAGVFVFPDVTDLKQAEKEFRESEERLNTIVKSIPDIVYRLDTESRIIFISDAISMYGYDAPSLIGKSIFDLIHPDDRLKADNIVNERKRGIHKSHDLELRILHQAHPQTPMYFSVTAVGIYQKNEIGEDVFIGTQGIARDITDRLQMKKEKEKLEQKLRQAQKMEAIGTLAGGIAHDFNNILSAIFGYTQLAQRFDLENPKVAGYLEQIFAASQRAKSLVQQILTFSRQDKSEKVPCDISMIIKEAIKLLRASLPTTIEIRQNIRSNLGIVIADQTQIHQVLMNLCTNAAHAMSEIGGILDISLSLVRLDAEVISAHEELVPGRYLKLSVSDTGTGMSSEIMERIFEPYFTTKEVGEGTGMGLAMVHGIVKAHDGAVRVQSEIGAGSRFDVFLPVMEGRADSQAKETNALPLGKERILFVDDEQFLVEIGQEMLMELGYKVDSHTDPINALNAFRRAPESYDLIITDLTMPHMTGDILIREIRKLRPAIPAVLCTGFGKKMTIENLAKLGIRQVLLKPIRIADLAEIVRKALDAGETSDNLPQISHLSSSIQ